MKLLQIYRDYIRRKKEAKIRSYVRLLKGVDNLGRMRYLIASFPGVVRVTTEESRYSFCSIYLTNGYKFMGSDARAKNATRKAAAEYFMYLWRNR